MASRSIDDLHARCRALWELFDSQMRAQGQDYIITCTYRSNDEQAQLYAQGRTKPGPIVTKAMPGQSAHNVFLNGAPAACAFDIVVMQSGKPQWNVRNPAWQIAGKIGQSVGLDWAGSWTSFVEFPHFQVPNWKDIANGKP